MLSVYISNDTCRIKRDKQWGEGQRTKEYVKPEKTSQVHIGKAIEAYQKLR